MAKGYPTKSTKIYMMVTADVYELPLAISDSLADLSKITGIKEDNLRNKFKNCRRGLTPRDYGVVRVEWIGGKMKIIVDFNYGGKEEFECDTYSIDEERGVLQIRTDKETVGMIMLNTIKYWKVEDK